MRNNLTGIVLCGGLSTRMGTDKGLINSQGDTWAQIQQKKLLHTGKIEEVFLSIREEQKHSYLQFFKENELIVDEVNIGGPLRGILSAHKKISNSDLLIIACDLQLIPSEKIHQLISQKYENEAVVFKTNKGEIEPLLGIYTSTFLNKILKSVDLGILKKYAIHTILENSNCTFLTINDSEAAFFKNFNTSEDV